MSDLLWLVILLPPIALVSTLVMRARRKGQFWPVLYRWSWMILAGTLFFVNGGLLWFVIFAIWIYLAWEDTISYLDFRAARKKNRNSLDNH